MDKKGNPKKTFIAKLLLTIFDLMTVAADQYLTL